MKAIAVDSTRFNHTSEWSSAIDVDPPTLESVPSEDDAYLMSMIDYS
jgi:hypothetical protein